MIEISNEAKARLLNWLERRPDSPAKEQAEVIAKVWIQKGTQAAKVELSNYAKEKNLVLWEQQALSDLVLAYYHKLKS